MQDSNVSPSSRTSISSVLPYVLLGAIVLVLFIVAFRYYPLGDDWETYHIAAQDWLHPYEEEKFVGMPIVLLVLPHALLDLQLGNAINIIIHGVVLVALIRAYGGDLMAMLLTFTSPIFIFLTLTNNVDWIPALAFLLPSMWGLPFLIAKPQGLGGAALIWWKREGFSPKMLIPSSMVVVVSLLIWGNWLPEVISGSGEINNTAWNFSPFPVGVPVGIYLLYKAYRSDDEILAASATPLLVPYFAPYSLAPLMALLATRYRTIAIFIYWAAWFAVVVETRRLSLIE